jgi:hypothetical protein
MSIAKTKGNMASLMKRERNSIMARFGIRKIALAIVALALAGSADQARAADLSAAGFAYGGWGGPATFGYGYGGPAYYSTGYMGGYVGGGGWGYTGSCCNDIWAGYCNEMQCCGGCRVKHRHRALGCGAGPCCQPTCAQGACGPAADCCQPGCDQAPVCCAAPRPRRHRCGLRRRFCAPACGMAECGFDSCCGGDAGAVSMPAEMDAVEPQSAPSDAPKPEAIESPAPAPDLDNAT